MKRLVFYCPGYDLRPLRSSLPLIEREFEAFLEIRKLAGRLEAPVDGLDPGRSTATWEGRVSWPGAKVHTRFVQLGWRDVIKPDFERSWPRMAADAISSFWHYAKAGGYRAAVKSNWAHGLFCLYPEIGFALCLALGIVPPLLLAAFLFDLDGDAGPQVSSQLLALAVIIGVSTLWIAGLHRFFSWLEPRIYLRYLINSWHFMARLARNEHAQMLDRIEEFAELIVAMEEEAGQDEELVFVSHSCGTFVAIYVLAGVLRRRPEIGQRPGGFAFVTLGPAFECLGGFGSKGSFSEAMSKVALSDVDWTDVYAPHDLVCGGRTAPVARYATAITEADMRREPRRFSVRVPDRMTKELFRHLRYRFFELHFCYFLSSIRPGLFDFYRLTLGPKRASAQLEAWSRGED
ncbi:hypothetical protein GCM10011316_05380 [Roseibium aquae]|uniref:Uncharacterized protein n=1 Tax=Roseibium aquae TaxID=1323746 RepID=A0A916TBF1_9HYPH|nr:hypothetical protein [Roseibium aquae]GGB36150.1 hypothetical protein GCM10011316_05380 [Roseibium aquae]